MSRLPYNPIYDYPELAAYLENKSIDEKWIPWSSIARTLIDDVNDSDKVFQLIDSNIEYLSSSLIESENSDTRKSRHLVFGELERFESQLMSLAENFYSRATEIKSLRNKLINSEPIVAMPLGTSLSADLRDGDEITRLFQFINVLCATVAWYNTQYGRYDETPIELFLKFFGFPRLENNTDDDQSEFERLLGRRIREYLSQW